MEPQKSRVIVTTLALLGAAIVFGGLGYYIGGMKTSSTAQPSLLTQVVSTPGLTITPALTPSPLTTNEFSSWKTYQSTALHYSVQYPDGWVEAGKEYKSPHDDLVLHSPDTVKYINSPGKTELISDFTVQYFESPQKLITNGNVESGAKSLLDYLTTEKAKQTNIYGYQSAKIGTYDGYKVDETSIGDMQFYYLERNGHVYRFILGSDSTELKQILSTVKFTN